MIRKEGDSIKSRSLFLLSLILIVGFLFFASAVVPYCTYADRPEDKSLCENQRTESDCMGYQECKWVTCSAGYNPVFSSCSGTYLGAPTYTIDPAAYTCSGTYSVSTGSCKCGGVTTNCDSLDCGQYMSESLCEGTGTGGTTVPSDWYNILAIITGNPIQEPTNDTYCYWSGSTTSSSCSSFTTQSSCTSRSGCSWSATKLNTCQGVYDVPAAGSCDCDNNDPNVCADLACWNYDRDGCLAAGLGRCMWSDGGWVNAPCTRLTNEIDCKNHSTCTWIGYIATYPTLSCSGLTESQCIAQNARGYCSSNYNCVKVTGPKANCETCTSDSECQSGECTTVITDNGLSQRCGDSSICTTYLGGVCSSDYQYTQEVCSFSDSKVYYCDYTTEPTWVYQNTCPYGCSNSVSCNTQPVPTLNWKNSELTSTYSTTAMSPIGLSGGDTVSLVANNGIGGTFSLKEIDDGEGALNFNDNVALNYATTQSAAGVLYNQFTFTNDLFNTLFLETNEGTTLEFRFEYVQSGTTYTSPILYVQRSLADACSNGVLDSGEVGIDCGGTCPTACTCDNDNVCDAGETQENCLCDCSPKTKSVVWSMASNPVSVSVDAIKNGQFYLQMKLLYPSAQDSTFTLSENDLLGGDDLIKDKIAGTYGVTVGCNTPQILVTYAPTIADFKKADESGNSYELYFTSEGLESEILTVNLDAALPYCGDGTCDADESELNCSADCLACAEKLVCADYNEATCEKDECGVTKVHSGKCVWNTLTNVCTEAVPINKNGVDVGTCFYQEDTSADNCDDSFLTYSFTANWIWAPENNLASIPLGANPMEYIYDTLMTPAVYHYDPEAASSACKSDTATIPCPAQVELSYFTWKNLIIAVILIFFIYLLIKLRKKKKSSKTKAVKKTQKKVVKKSSSVKKKSVKRKTAKRR